MQVQPIEIVNDVGEIMNGKGNGQQPCVIAVVNACEEPGGNTA